MVKFPSAHRYEEVLIINPEFPQFRGAGEEQQQQPSIHKDMKNIEDYKQYTISFYCVNSCNVILICL